MRLNMNLNALDIAQIIIAIVLIGSILLQNRGSGMGMAFGSDDSSYRTKRGAERTLHIITIILGTAFLVIAFINAIY
jgi:preprotein translocase subunit SecG